jgi:hypothetical protein
MSLIADAFGETDEPENDQALAAMSDREQQLTQLHAVKSDAMAAVRPMLKMSLESDGIKRVTENRKAAVKLRTSVDKRRKEISAEAKKWIDTVNGVAADIVAILAPAEAHLKGLEAEHERRIREAEDAERAERIALRRATWPADAGEFPEAEAGAMSSIDFAGLTIVRKQQAKRQREEAEQRAAERAELEVFRQKQAEIDRAFAEKPQTFADRLQAKAAELKPVEPVTEPVVLPVSEGVGRIADELREVWTPQPASRPERDAETRLNDLIRSLKYLMMMSGEVDWRGQIVEAILDAQS